MADVVGRESAGVPAGQGLFVLCAANNYDTVKVADHHMAECLARHGELLYVDPPLSHLSPRRDPTLAASLRGPRLRRTSAGFWRLTPVVAPFPGRPGMAQTTRHLTLRALRGAVASIGLEVSVLMSAWPRLNVLGSCGERVSIWWAQDDFAAGAQLMGVSARRTALGERAQADRCDLIVAANPLLAERWRNGHEVELIPYGCKPRAFADRNGVTPADDVHLESPVAIVMGQFNSRTDPTLLDAVAQAGISLLLVGPERGADWLAALARRPNVTWVGQRAFEELPRYLAHAQVGLVPYTQSEFNRASFPLKTLEYLAAGLPVVSTDLPGVRWLDAEPALVRLADGPEEFAGAVTAAIASDNGLDPDRRRAFARSHSYEQRAAQLLRAIDERFADVERMRHVASGR